MTHYVISDETLTGCSMDGGVGLWTAGQRLDSESCYSPYVWKLSQCSMAEMGYANWCWGQPNFWRAQESCAHLYTTSDISCWNDIYCGTDMCFVCEIDL